MRLDEEDLDDPDAVMDVMTDMPLGEVTDEWNRALVRFPKGRPVELRYVTAERPHGEWVGWQARRGGPFEDVDTAYVQSLIEQYGPVEDLELVERALEDGLERYWDLDPLTGSVMATLRIARSTASRIVADRRMARPHGF